MKIPNDTVRRAMNAAGWMAPSIVLWIAAAWLGRAATPARAAWTNLLFAAALLCTYAGVWGGAIAGSRDRRRTAFRALAVTAGILAAVLALEAPVSVDLIDYQALREALTDPKSPDVSYVEDRHLSFRRAPYFHWQGVRRPDIADYFNLPMQPSRRLTFSTDGDGFRNRADIARADVALIGDSYVEGVAVSDEDTLAERLHQSSGLVVRNLGMSGYGPLQELRVLEKFALPIAPRLIAWFFFEGNDLDDDQTFENAMMAYEGPGGSAPRPNPLRLRPLGWDQIEERSFTRNMFLLARRLTDVFVPNPVDTYGWFRDRDGTNDRLLFYSFYATRPFGEFEAQRFETTKTTLRTAESICRDRNIRLMVFFVPIKFRVYGDLCAYPPGSPCPRWTPWDLEARFLAFCRSAGVACASLTEPLREAARRGELLYAPSDSHWNERGNAVVAEQVRRAWAALGSHDR